PPQREALRVKVARWVFQSAWAQRYSEGTDNKQIADLKVVQPWLSGTGPVPPFLDEAAVWSNASNLTIRSGARAKALVALLNESGPKDFIMTSKRPGRGSGRQPSQLHHIFPKKHLEREGLDKAVADIALNLTFLTPESNNFINDRAPSEY